MRMQSLRFLLLSALLAATVRAGAQVPKDNSPFSQFGLGDFIPSDLPSSRGMGGLQNVYHDFFEANLDNPASLGFLQYTALQVDAFVKVSNYKRFDGKAGIWNGNLDHLSLNIPIINPLNEALERRETGFAWGTSFSIRPVAQVGYDVMISDSIPEFGLVNRNFVGAGTLYQAAWSNGIKYKDLSVGVSLGYLNGRQAFRENITFPDLANPYSDNFARQIGYRGFLYKIGAMYDHPLDRKAAQAKGEGAKPEKFIAAGFTWNGSTTYETQTDIAQILRNGFTGDLDTVQFARDRIQNGTMPSTFGFGLMYRYAGKFRVGVDYQSAAWSEYTNPERYTPMDNLTRIAFGGAYIPDASALTSYFKRVEYRAGFYTLKDPRIIEGEQVNEWAITTGMLMPLILQRNIAWMQVGLEVGHRTGGPNLSDTFVRGKVGFVLNDNSWFIRGKYN